LRYKSPGEDSRLVAGFISNLQAEFSELLQRLGVAFGVIRGIMDVFSDAILFHSVALDSSEGNP